VLRKPRVVRHSREDLREPGRGPGIELGHETAFSDALLTPSSKCALRLVRL
jgi:hypothetical protein